MWLILTESRNSSRSWLTEGLRTRTRGPVHNVTADDLCRVVTIETGHDDETPIFTIHLGSGFIIDSRTVHGVVNTITALPPGLAQRCEGLDRAAVVRNYASPAWRLFSDLACPFLNRPSAQGLVGDFRVPSDWTHLARDLGLPPASFDLLHAAKAGLDSEARVSVVVIAGEVVSLDASPLKMPAAVITKCRTLADAARTSILALDLRHDGNGGWSFAGADSRPDLRPGGDAALDAIARALGTHGVTAAGSASASWPLQQPANQADPSGLGRLLPRTAARWRSLFS